MARAESRKKRLRGARGEPRLGGTAENSRDAYRGMRLQPVIDKSLDGKGPGTGHLPKNPDAAAKVR